MEEERAKEERGPDGGSRVWRLRPGGRHGSRALRRGGGARHRRGGGARRQRGGARKDVEEGMRWRARGGGGRGGGAGTDGCVEGK
jgi:hypothetical protein